MNSRGDEGFEASVKVNKLKKLSADEGGFFLLFLPHPMLCASIRVVQSSNLGRRIRRDQWLGLSIGCHGAFFFQSFEVNEECREELCRQERTDKKREISVRTRG